METAKNYERDIESMKHWIHRRLSSDNDTFPDECANEIFHLSCQTGFAEESSVCGADSLYLMKASMHGWALTF